MYIFQTDVIGSHPRDVSLEPLDSVLYTNVDVPSFGVKLNK